MKKKKIIIPALALVVLGAGAYGISQAGAESNRMGREAMIQRIAQRFGLNEEEVEKVFEENKSERQAQMKSNYEQMLTEAVSKGELTEEQKQLILAKKEEMWQEREKNREAHMNMSVEERRTEMEKRHAELEQWAKDNGIDIKYLIGMGMGKMGSGGFMRGMMNNN